MKKILLLLSLLSFSFVVGCSLNITTSSTTETTTTQNTTVSSTTTSNTTTSSTTTSSTTVSNTTTSTVSTDDDVIEAINQEMSRIFTYIPNEVTENITLPLLDNLNMTLNYYQDGVLLETNVFVYTPSIDGIYSKLRIEIIYGDQSVSQEFTLYLVENETEYYIQLKEQTFSEINAILNEYIPEEIVSDFYIPDIEMDGVSITYEIDSSYVFNGYFVFPYPEQETILNLDVTIMFMGVTRMNEYDIVMKAVDDLPNIPRIYINTENQTEITSKEEYINATFSMVTYDEENNETTYMETQHIRIRGRGNSTFFMPKMSFRIKFDEKTNMLFDHYEDDWVLLANFADQTLIRNYLAHSLSRSMNMEFTPAAAFVDVYLNDEYIGNYMLSDQIEVTNDRVDIEEHSSALDTGYLLEMDRRLIDIPSGEVEGWDYFMIYGYPYMIKSPKTDAYYYSQEQLYFIEDYILNVHLTLMNQRDYSNLIDESTFVDWFIVQELFKNVDSGYSSVYMYKDRGGLLKMGPIWDFDLSTSNPGHLQDDLRVPEGWYTSLEYKNIWYYYLMQYDTFRTALKERWNELYDNQIHNLIESVYPVANSISKSRYMNFQRWDIIGSWSDWYTSTEVFEAKTYQEQLKILYDYLLVRSEWLNQEINKF